MSVANNLPRRECSTGTRRNTAKQRTKVVLRLEVTTDEVVEVTRDIGDAEIVAAPHESAKETVEEAIADYEEMIDGELRKNIEIF